MRAGAAVKGGCGLFAVALVGLLSAASAQGATVITPTTVHVSTAWEWSNVQTLINGVGMLNQSGDISTWTHDEGKGNDTGMWLNAPYGRTYGTAPFTSGDWILVNLGEAINLNKVWLWQYNCFNPLRDLQHFRIYGSLTTDNGNESTGPQQQYFEIGGGRQTLAQTPGNAPELGQAFNLTGATGIKAVVIHVIDNYGDAYTGLSEVRFESAPPRLAPVLLIQ